MKSLAPKSFTWPVLPRCCCLQWFQFEPVQRTWKKKWHFSSASSNYSTLEVGFHSLEGQHWSRRDRVREERRGSPWCAALCGTQPPFRKHSSHTQSHLRNGFWKKKNPGYRLPGSASSFGVDCVSSPGPNPFKAVFRWAAAAASRRGVQTACGQCGRRSSCPFLRRSHLHMSLCTGHVSISCCVVSPWAAEMSEREGNSKRGFCVWIKYCCHVTPPV